MSGFDEEFEFEIDADDFTSDDLAGNGGQVDRAGFYHVAVLDWSHIAVEGKTPRVNIKMQVYAGTQPSQINRMIYHDIYLSGKDGAALSVTARKAGTRFFVGMGLLERTAADASKVKWPFKKLTGAQGIVEIREEEYEGKKQYKIPFGNAFRFDDEKVKDVPTCAELLETAGAGAGDVDVSDL